MLFLDYSRLDADFYDVHKGDFGLHEYAMRTQSLKLSFNAAVFSRECENSAYVSLVLCSHLIYFRYSPLAAHAV